MPPSGGPPGYVRVCVMSRERLPYSCNDAEIVNWARTVRIECVLSDAERRRIAQVLDGMGADVAFRCSDTFDRTYALVQGSPTSEPIEAEAVLPQAHWFPDVVLALAIEPSAPQALPALLHAFAGNGAPAGVRGCERRAQSLIVEFALHITPPELVLNLADIELRRFAASRSCRLLSPLPESDLAAIAARGLNAPEIASNRILESLLEGARVE